MAGLVGEHDVEQPESGKKARKNRAEDVTCLRSAVVGAIGVEGEGGVVECRNEYSRVGEGCYGF